MVNLPGGSFLMGCTPEQAAAFPCLDYTLPVRSVTVTPFSMGKFEVTQAEWDSIVPEYHPTDQYCNGPDKPVINVSFYEILTYCNRLSQKHNLEPCYYFDAAYAHVFDTLLSSINAINFTFYWKLNADGYRLPTEAEWEYAARGNSNTVYAGSNNVGNVAWYSFNNTPYGCHDVGLKSANIFGLKDMSGNVAERVWDWEGFYPSINQTNPIGGSPPFTYSDRVVRGGGVYSDPMDVTTIARGGVYPSVRYSAIGFRLARGGIGVQCSDQLAEPQEGAIDVNVCTSIRWNKKNVAVAGYKLSIGTTPGGGDILNNVVVQDTFYRPLQPLPAHKTIYVRVVPFSAAQTPTGCPEFSFSTGSDAPLNALGIAPPTHPAVCHFPQVLQLSGDTSLVDDYVWSTGETTPSIVVTEPGTYSLTSYFQGCIDTAQVTIAMVDFLNFPRPDYDLTVITSPLPGQNNGAIDLAVQGGTPPYTFQWFTAFLEPLPSTTAHLDSIQAGYYNVQITDYLGCDAGVAYTFCVMASSGLDELENGNSLRIYPNPHDGYVNLEVRAFLPALVNIDIFDVAGKKVAGISEACTGDFFAKRLDLTALANGAYWMRCIVGNQAFIRKVWKG